jgi:hypothetical protein
MVGIGWPAEATRRKPVEESRALPEELWSVARGESALTEALLTLAHHQAEQAYSAAELLERETWALTAILERIAPLWRHLPQPTLRFASDRPDAPHLELGLFSHLATLVAPSAGEQALMSAATPLWARVYTRRTRLPAGQFEAIVRTYVPISVAEAVAALGLGRILNQINIMTRNAGRTLLDREQAQRERQVRLLGVERMLGWEPDPVEAQLFSWTAARRYLLMLLLGEGNTAVWVPGAALVALTVIVVTLFFGIPIAVLALIVGTGCLLLRALLSG